MESTDIQFRAEHVIHNNMVDMHEIYISIHYTSLCQSTNTLNVSVLYSFC